MDRLVTDLLDMARVESGSFVVRTEPINIASVIRDAVDLFESQAGRAQDHLRVQIQHELPEIEGDRERLAQVFSNLIGNALKFSNAGSAITVQAISEVASVHVSIKDSGAGISPQNLVHVFDRFWQADRSTGNGAGLGLAICKAIVEAHGGRIWAASKVGYGSTFHFEIPKRHSSSRAAADPSFV